MTTKAVILLSGGMDSTTALAISVAKFDETVPLFVDYEQRHIAEWEAACIQALQFANTMPIRLHVTPPFAETCSLTQKDVNFSDTGKGYPNSFVPMRNMIFLSYAFSLAHKIKASTIVLGTNTADYSGYPDCRITALEAVTTAADRCLGNDLERMRVKKMQPRIELFLPLNEWGKDRIIKEGIALGVDYSKTVTCYAADDKGRACGICPSCTIRRNGFKKAGIKDSTIYY